MDSLLLWNKFISKYIGIQYSHLDISSYFRNVKNIQKLNEIELQQGVSVKNSWHQQYKDSAWIFIGGLNYELTEGDILCVFSQYGEVRCISPPIYYIYIHYIYDINIFFFSSKGVFPKIWGHPAHSIGSTHTTLLNA